jgi:hypothetical protein
MEMRLGKSRVHLREHTRTERSRGVVPQDPQEGVSLVDRLPELLGSRDGDSGRVQRLQPGKDPLSTGLSAPHTNTWRNGG